MKNIQSFDFKGFLLFLIFSISVFSFIDKPDKPNKPDKEYRLVHGKYVVNLEIIRVTDAASVAGIPETTGDVLLVVDRATTVAAATCPFPFNPVHGQIIGISTRVQITALTLDDGPNDIPISGYTAPFNLAANTVFWRVYDLPSNRWFPF